LSGGERNRLLLARLFAKPSNVLVLDEPTNDLDIDTLDLLEDMLSDYPGTVFLVSHDRRFLDNVVTSTLVSEGNGAWREYEGGVEDWLIQSRRAQALAAGKPGAANIASAVKPSAAADTRTPVATAPAPVGEAAKPRKLSYKEQRELDEIPGRIEALETEQKRMGDMLADPELYKTDPKQIAVAQARFDAIDEELLTVMERWETLGKR
jgi:ATP-binding cassette subfamily F protein uup